MRFFERLIDIAAFGAAFTLLTLPASAVPTTQAASTPGTAKVVLQGGTPITFEVVDKVSSGTANVGDTFGVRVTQDVVVNGWVVVAKGADGMGEVTKVDRAGAHGHPGSLSVVIDWVHDVNGDKVKLTPEQKSSEGRGEQGASSTTTIVSYLVFGPLGLFAHNFVKGHEMELTPENTAEHPLTAYVDTSVYVTATKQESAGFAQAVPESSATP